MTPALEVCRWGCSVKRQAQNHSSRMVVRRAGDAGGPDPGVDGLGKGAILDQPPRLARIIGEPLAFPRRLDAAIVHLEDQTLRPLLADRLDVDPGVEAESQRPLQAGEAGCLGEAEESPDRPGLEGGKACPAGVVAALRVPDPVALFDRLEPDPVAGEPVSPQIAEQAEEFLFRKREERLGDAIFQLEAERFGKPFHLDGIALLPDRPHDVEGLCPPQLMLHLGKPEGVVDDGAMEEIHRKAGQLLPPQFIRSFPCLVHLFPFPLSESRHRRFSPGCGVNPSCSSTADALPRDVRSVR